MRRLPECSDEDLLLRIIADDRTAFEALVERHEAMVLRACLQVLHQRQDAEDAYQAALWVLWQKADSIQDIRKLEGWLRRVARKESLRIRKSKQRRERCQHSCDNGEQITQITDEVELQEVQAIVRTELQRLPNKYRLPLILCYLEAKSKEEAAAELSLPVGTLSCHLARGRKLLRRRLAHYGFGAPD